ncbi:hypothetical protein Tco_0891048 [Tanacetum coccineum]|uniref:Uncharacterized protein n=1 Tax=Tanacetum coccineum TaxID=301880 RepID=A0ABQ5C1S3_9ASTR
MKQVLLQTNPTTIPIRDITRVNFVEGYSHPVSSCQNKGTHPSLIRGIQPKQAEQEEQEAKSFTLYGNFSMIDDVKVLQDRENLMKDMQTFLRKFSRIPFGEIPKVLLVAWERFYEIKHAFTDKQYQQEDIQELMSKLLEDVGHINEELSEFINSPSWNCPTFYNEMYCVYCFYIEASTSNQQTYQLRSPYTLYIPPGIESDLDSEGDIVFLDNLLNEYSIPEYERFTFDIEPDAPVINNFDELNEDECFDPGGGEIDVEDDDSFTFVIQTFLSYLTYPGFSFSLLLRE